MLLIYSSFFQVSMHGLTLGQLSMVLALKISLYFLHDVL